MPYAPSDIKARLRFAEHVGRRSVCDGKRRYETEIMAIWAAEATNGNPRCSHKVVHYPCPFCGGWHVGREIRYMQRRKECAVTV